MQEEMIVLEEESVVNEKSFPLFRILYKNLIFILIATILCGALGLGIGFLRVKPQYTASCDMALNLTLDASGYTNEQLIANNTTLAKSYLPTVIDTIISPKTVSLAKSYNNNDIVASSIKIGYNEESLIFNISYTDETKELAISKLKDIIKASQTNVVTEKPIVVTNIKLVETQRQYDVIESNSRGMYLLVGLVIGLVGGIAVSLLIYLLDNKIKTAEELEELTESSVVAYITKRK